MSPQAPSAPTLNPQEAESKALVRLQELDLQLLRHAASLKAMPEEKKLETIALARKKVQGELTKIVGRRKDLQTEVGDLEDDLLHYHEVTEEVRGQADERAQDYRQVRDLEAQLTSLAKRIEKCEFNLKRTREELQRHLTAERNANLTLERLDRECEATQEAFDRSSGDLKAQIRTLAAEREATAAKITPEVMSRYEQARKRFKGLAVETLVGNVPSVCRVKLQPSSYNDLIHGPLIAECPYCHRMLVRTPVVERQDEDASAKGKAPAGRRAGGDAR